MSDLTKLSVAAALQSLEKGEFSAVELTKAHIASMEKQRALNAYITETPELALERASESDARRKAGQAGALEGIPIAMKDLFCTKGVQSTAASHILEGFKPQYESTVSAKLQAAGTIMLGKANLDEFAMGSSNTTSYYGNVANPWQRADGKTLVPGGSSGGSAAAVAAHMAMAATGTDTGGSIRQPAAFCGISGIKPTYGRCSRWGIIAFASSLDQAGIFARNVEDCALMLQSMAGFDPMDSTSVDIKVPNFSENLEKPIKGMKIGLPAEYRVAGMNPEIAAMWDKAAAWLQEQGAELVPISLPHTKYALATYYIIAPAECSSNLARYDGMRFGLREKGADLTEVYENTRGKGFGKEVKRRIMIGTYVLSAGYYDAYYVKAQKLRALIAQDFAHSFQQCDAILTPTAPSSAFAIGENQDDPIAMYLNDVFTVPASMAGLPGMSVPSMLASDGLPLGVQIIGRPFDEATVLQVARAIERAAGFKGLA
ncbi:MAG: Asp-tRNA(Asn)/Glu-tRNA(Gln) amidotransferase subunit GatA [Alphaproteobacteria bacterium]